MRQEIIHNINKLPLIHSHSITCSTGDEIWLIMTDPTEIYKLQSYTIPSIQNELLTNCYSMSNRTRLIGISNLGLTSKNVTFSFFQMAISRNSLDLDV